MACSRFEYVKQFERHESILPNCWFIVRIDGHGFHRFTKIHQFEKPNDSKGLELANAAAQKVMEEFKDICAAYGQSDEYSFVFKRSCTLFERRQEKILSTVVSYFSSNYVYLWNQFMERPLELMPSFDGRIVVYPTLENVRDYLSWRQADCHINNLYNTCFWALVQQQSLSHNEAQKILKDTDSGQKNELLFSQFGMNYNSLPEMFRKGSFVSRQKVESHETTKEGRPITRMRSRVTIQHIDIIGDLFWNHAGHVLFNN